MNCISFLILCLMLANLCHGNKKVDKKDKNGEVKKEASIQSLNHAGLDFPNKKTDNNTKKLAATKHQMKKEYNGKSGINIGSKKLANKIPTTLSLNQKELNNTKNNEVDKKRTKNKQTNETGINGKNLSKIKNPSKECCQKCCGGKENGNEENFKSVLLNETIRNKRMAWTCGCGDRNYNVMYCNICDESAETNDPCVNRPSDDDVQCSSCISKKGCAELSSHYKNGGCRWDPDDAECSRYYTNEGTASSSGSGDPCVTRPSDDDVSCSSCTTRAGCQNMSRFFKNGQCDWDSGTEECSYVAETDPCISRPTDSDVMCSSCTTEAGCENLSPYYANNGGECRWEDSQCDYHDIGGGGGNSPDDVWARADSSNDSD